MNHEEIKRALTDKGLTFAALARAAGMLPQSLTICSARKGLSRPAALVIAAGLEMPVEKVFPDKPQYQCPSSKEKKDKANGLAREALNKAGIKTTAA